MGDRSNKRRSSRSRSRDDSSKRVRHLSASVSARSQHSDNSHRLPRAKSIFRGENDPYYPHRNGVGSLPKNDDYLFRLKVISSSTDLGNDVFKRAVQGLVKICFPEGVLEELGLSVVEQHMREDNAPQANIDKMIAVFRSEMIHRLIWMLAQHLDSTSKIESGVKATVAACAKLHGDDIGKDVLGDVIRSLQKISVQLSTESTNDLATTTMAELSDDSPETNESTESILEQSSVQSPKKRSKKKRKTEKKGDDQYRNPISRSLTPTSSEIRAEGISVDVEMVREPPATISQPDKDKKVSASWRWNVEISDKSMEVLKAVFVRTSDLFAYHALPIARASLEATATRKQIRREIQAMLNNMTWSEYLKWKESFHKFHAGDRMMLIRTESKPSDKRLVLATTPAPIEIRVGDSRTIEEATNQHEQRARNTRRVSIQPQSNIIMKFESNANHNGVAASANNRSSQDDITAATAAFRHLSTEEPELPPSSTTNGPSARNRANLISENASSGVGLVGSSLKDGRPAPNDEVGTPIMDLLLGPVSLRYRTGTDIADTLMAQLNKRVQLMSVTTQMIDGGARVMTKAALQSQLRALKPSSARFGSARFKKVIEDKLVPWVVAQPSAFPELLSQSFLFANMMPMITPVLDVLIDSRSPMTTRNALAVRTELFGALYKRGFLPTHPIGDISLQNTVNNILGYPRSSEIAKRGQLEKRLRVVVHANRSRFSDLKSSTLVKTWERETGLSWLRLDT
ncbi:hypothetical protein ACN47E_001221 [Coniothyrium glycines]